MCERSGGNCTAIAGGNGLFHTAHEAADSLHTDVHHQRQQKQHGRARRVLRPAKRSGIHVADEYSLSDGGQRRLPSSYSSNSAPTLSNSSTSALLLGFLMWSATFSVPLTVFRFTLLHDVLDPEPLQPARRPGALRLPMAFAALWSVHRETSAIHPKSSTNDCIPKPSTHPVTIP